MINPYQADVRHWRVGRKVGRTLYAQAGAAPADDDPLIGVLDHAVLAHRIVNDHNRRISGRDLDTLHALLIELAHTFDAGARGRLDALLREFWPQG